MFRDPNRNLAIRPAAADEGCSGPVSGHIMHRLINNQDWILQPTDIAVTLCENGEALGGGDWSLRLYYKPLVRWIWLGGIFIALGGLLAASDKRYRMTRRRRAEARWRDVIS